MLNFLVLKGSSEKNVPLVAGVGGDTGNKILFKMFLNSLLLHGWKMSGENFRNAQVTFNFCELL